MVSPAQIVVFITAIRFFWASVGIWGYYTEIIEEFGDCPDRDYDVKEIDLTG